jgi:hypothetical protein
MGHGHYELHTQHRECDKILTPLPVPVEELVLVSKIAQFNRGAPGRKSRNESREMTTPQRHYLSVKTEDKPCALRCSLVVLVFELAADQAEV